MTDLARVSRPSPSIAARLREQLLTVPNGLTFLRLWIAYHIFYDEVRLGAILCWMLVAVLTDVIDGLIARWFNQCTGFGKRIDQFADAVLGAVMMYTIWTVEGWTWYNVPPFAAICVFTIAVTALRFTRCTEDTNAASKVRIALQYIGGLFIIHAYVHEDIEALIGGYVFLWVSIGLMWISIREYWNEALPKLRELARRFL